jgi:hypothetical protein
MPILTGLALWSEYNRAALTGLSGLPVYVCNYDELVNDPLATVTSIHASLVSWNEVPASLDADADAEIGAAVDDRAALAAAAARIRPELRRNTWPRDNVDALEVPGEIERLMKFMADLGGAHSIFEPGRPLPSPWEQALLSERRTRLPRERMAAAESQSLRERNEALVQERDELRQAKESVKHQLHARNLEFDALTELARVETARAVELGHDLHAARTRINAVEADLAEVNGRRRAAEKEARDAQRRLQALERSRLLRISRALKQLRRSLSRRS